MKKIASFNIGIDHLDKIDKMKIKRGTNRSEALDSILNEYFSSNDINFVEELERIKLQNIDLRYQLEKMVKKMASQNKEILTMLLIIGGQNDVTKDEMMKRFPQYWPK